ncbi:NAD(P)-binding domain-containing protein [Pseudoroseomonas wenyumeiae]
MSTANPIRRIGFIGIGNMGWPMAARLHAAGFELAICDAVPDRAARFASEVGGTAAANGAEAARGADAVITILPTSKQVAEVVAGIREALAPGALLIEMNQAPPA